MKKTLALFFFLILAGVSLSAQVAPNYQSTLEGPMSLNRKFGLLQIGDTLLEKNQTHLYLSPEAESLYRSGDSLSSVGDWMIGFGAGFALGHFLGDMIFPKANKNANSNANAYVYGACGLVVAVGIPLHIVGVKKIKRAIDDYNTRNGNANRASELNFGIQGSGIALSYHF
ncbi:MAG: hypothetical protein IKX28_02690 [Bacteroidales bacterium]|nr:hypothetical protein [Bacteroidales bacterium]